MHTSVFVSFETIQYSIWCQNRGCICISSTRRTYRSNPHPSCIHSSFYKQNFPQRRVRDRIIQQSYQHTEHSFYTVERLSWIIQLKFCTFPQEIQQVSSHPMEILTTRTPRNTSITRLIPCTETILHTRGLPTAVQHGSKHSAWQKLILCPYSILGGPVILPAETAF